MILLMHSLILKNDTMNLFTKQKQTDRYPKHIHGYQRGNKSGRGINQDLGMSINTVLYIR